jgi:hypothetical protein
VSWITLPDLPGEGLLDVEATLSVFGCAYRFDSLEVVAWIRAWREIVLIN